MSVIKGTNQIVAGFGGTKRSIGEVYFSQSSLATDNSGALPLFTGETITSANTIYPDFYNWVLSHTELQCTSAEYESALTTYGECAKYVIGGGSLRLPLIKNYIKAANPSEGIKNIEAGLPNIMGDVLPNEESGNTWTLKTGLCSGAFSAITNSPSAASVASVEQNKPAGIRFDASKYNAVYGASSTVTPASTTLYPWVVAYTAAIPASTVQAAEFQQGLSGKSDTNLGNVASNIDYVVESYNDGTNWYRKYKSGWVEQGGYYTGGNQIKTLLVPMANTNYTCLSACSFKGGTNWNGNPITIHRNSTTYISLNTYGDYTDCTGWWEVKGQFAA